VIPTTARSLDAYRRVDLPFDQLAILDFGGVVLLPDGTLDPTWDAEIRPRVLNMAGALRDLHRDLERFILQRELGVSARVIADFDMPLYVVVKHPRGDCAKLRLIRDEFLLPLNLDSFFIHMNDNNLSLVPAFLGKEHAVKHVIEKHLSSEPILTIGMGDSLTDAPFLSLCDFSMTPRDCQLARHRFQRGEGS